MKRALAIACVLSSAWSTYVLAGDAGEQLAPVSSQAALVDQSQPARPAARATTRASAAVRQRVASTTPFAFRDISLGITLDEMRQDNRARATPSNSQLVCETDMDAGQLGMPLKGPNSLVVSCRWAHRVGDGPLQLSKAVVAGVPADEHVMRFARDADGGPLRLYEISFVVDDVTADDLRGALRSRYGAPRMNSVASTPTYVWQNAVSSITLRVMPGSHTGKLTYLLKDPDTRVKSVEQDWQNSLADAG